MVLIITHKEDFTADFIVKKLNEKGLQYYRLNCEDILIKNNITLSLRQETEAIINGISKFTSVWFRRTKLPKLDEFEPDIRNYCHTEIDFFLKNLWLSINAERWMSRPDKIYQAENKFLQLRMAKELGFEVPETIMTGDVNVIKTFYDRTNGNLIIKPLFQGRIIKDSFQKLIFTTKLTQADVDELDERLPLPSLYQRYIDKSKEYRITVVNDKIFSASVDSQSNDETKIDWRRKKLKFEQANLPSTTQRLCIELTKKLGLTFGAIDMIKSKNGEFVFLEINPSGQWAWIEIDTGLPISDSIIEYLNSTHGKG
jgi:glutathione synthase/RimK-type ligase-like ATP-grasp enzyme